MTPVVGARSRAHAYTPAQAHARARTCLRDIYSPHLSTYSGIRALIWTVTQKSAPSATIRRRFARSAISSTRLVPASRRPASPPPIRPGWAVPKCPRKVLDLGIRTSATGKF